MNVEVKKAIPAELLERGFQWSDPFVNDFACRLEVANDLEIVVWKYQSVYLTLSNPSEYENVVCIDQRPDLAELLPLIDRLIATFKPEGPVRKSASPSQTAPLHGPVADTAD